MASINPDDFNGGALTATAATFLVLSYVSVGLRTYVRGFMLNSFSMDDWLMLVSQLIFTASCSFIIVGVERGLGRHNKALPQKREIDALMWQALATASYVLNMMFIKLSIALFLLRLSAQKRYTYTIWISAVIVFIWSTVIFFWNLFQCNPVQAQWDYTIPDKQCVTSEDIVSAAYSISVMTIVSDWLYALLPIPMIWKVKMTIQAKTTVVVILGLGIFASIATLIRLKFLSDLNDIEDILFAGTDAMVWTLIEPGVAIMASSLVTIRPLLRKMRLPGFMSTDRTGKSGGRSGRSGRSGTNRSAGRIQQLKSGGGTSHGRMPGFGPGDLTLVDLESSYKPPEPPPKDHQWMPPSTDPLRMQPITATTTTTIQTSPAQTSKPGLPAATPVVSEAGADTTMRKNDSNSGPSNHDKKSSSGSINREDNPKLWAPKSRFAAALPARHSVQSET